MFTVGSLSRRRAQLLWAKILFPMGYPTRHHASIPCPPPRPHPPTVPAKKKNMPTAIGAFYPIPCTEPTQQYGGGKSLLRHPLRHVPGEGGYILSVMLTSFLKKHCCACPGGSSTFCFCSAAPTGGATNDNRRVQLLLLHAAIRLFNLHVHVEQCLDPGEGNQGRRAWAGVQPVGFVFSVRPIPAAEVSRVHRRPLQYVDGACLFFLFPRLKNKRSQHTCTRKGYFAPGLHFSERPRRFLLNQFHTASEGSVFFFLFSFCMRFLCLLYTLRCA